MPEHRTLRKRFLDFMLGEKIEVSKRDLICCLGCDAVGTGFIYALTKSPEFSLGLGIASVTDNILQYKTGYHVYNLISRGIYKLYNDIK